MTLPFYELGSPSGKHLNSETVLSGSQVDLAKSLVNVERNFRYHRRDSKGVRPFAANIG